MKVNNLLISSLKREENELIVIFDIYSKVTWNSKTFWKTISNYSDEIIYFSLFMTYINGGVHVLRFLLMYKYVAFKLSIDT